MLKVKSLNEVTGHMWQIEVFSAQLVKTCGRESKQEKVENGTSKVPRPITWENKLISTFFSGGIQYYSIMQEEETWLGFCLVLFHHTFTSIETTLLFSLSLWTQSQCSPLNIVGYLRDNGMNRRKKIPVRPYFCLLILFGSKKLLKSEVGFKIDLL